MEFTSALVPAAWTPWQVGDCFRETVQTLIQCEGQSVDNVLVSNFHLAGPRTGPHSAHKLSMLALETLAVSSMIERYFGFLQQYFHGTDSLEPLKNCDPHFLF